MNYFRIYTDADGESHFEDIAVAFTDGARGSELSELIPATGVIFRRSPADQFIEASDGEVRRIGSGTVMLAEDTTGKGHITRGIGEVERYSIFVPLPD
jgi:hypothetical protein